ncbi:MAG: hypothetical protein E7436_06045 [Ruminococcaceae bacterium]|nr:hypothetical protein [Oscillospiraceae bacterium]
MKNLRSRFDRFCFRHRDKGIPNLMLYITLGSALVYLFREFTDSTLLYDWLYFDRDLILQGQVWRLFSYALTFDAGSLLMTAVGLICYYSLGSAIENSWGTLRFNLFYLCGILMMDIYALVLGAFLPPEYSPYLSYMVDVGYLNTSLFLAYATLYPDSHFLLFFIIPVKAWIFAIFDLAVVLFGLLSYSFPFNLFSVISLANYFLFFGKDIVNVFPVSWRLNARRLFKKKPKAKASEGPKVVPFPTAGSYTATTATVKAPYTHRCTVCGRTDVSDPDLEFRYCSRCQGYHCYCEDHISNHEHVQ